MEQQTKKAIKNLEKRSKEIYEYSLRLIKSLEIDDLNFINNSKLFMAYADPKFTLDEIYNVYEKYIVEIIMYELYFAENEEYEKAAIIKKAYELETEMVCNFLPEINKYKNLLLLTIEETIKAYNMLREE